MPLHKLSIKNLALTALILLILIPAIFLAEGFSQFGISKVFDSGNNSGDFKTALNLVVAIIVSSGIIAVFLKFIHKDNIKNIGFSVKNKGFDIILGISTGFILISIGFLFLVVLGMLEINDINFNLTNLLYGVLLMVLVSFHEEIIVRGYLLNVLMKLNSKIIALIISSLYFAMLHIFNNNIDVIPLLNIFLAGALLGVPYIFTKNLWFPIAFHFSWNFFQGPVLGFNVSGNINNSLLKHEITGSNIITGGEFGIEGSILTTIILSVTIVILYLYFQKVSELRKKVKIDFSDNQLYIKDDSEV